MRAYWRARGLPNMDNTNRFHTNETWLWVRAEQCLLLLVLIVCLALHIDDVAWGRFLFALLIIDLGGYLPGAIAYHRSGGGPLPPIYHHLYNVMHSYITTGAAVGLWALVGGGLEWAMLAVPIHLAGDRGIFGNTYKPTSLPFEPEAGAPPTQSPRAAVGEESH